MQWSSVLFPCTLLLLRSSPIHLTANNCALSFSTANSAICRDNYTLASSNTQQIYLKGRKYLKSERCSVLIHTVKVTGSIIPASEKQAFTTEPFLNARSLYIFQI